jgi:hypothetical protein
VFYQQSGTKGRKSWSKSVENGMKLMSENGIYPKIAIRMLKKWWFTIEFRNIGIPDVHLFSDEPKSENSANSETVNASEDQDGMVQPHISFSEPRLPKVDGSFDWGNSSSSDTPKDHIDHIVGFICWVYMQSYYIIQISSWYSTISPWIAWFYTPIGNAQTMPLQQLRLPTMAPRTTLDGSFWKPGSTIWRIEKSWKIPGGYPTVWCVYISYIYIYLHIHEKISQWWWDCSLPVWDGPRDPSF